MHFKAYAIVGKNDSLESLLQNYDFNWKIGGIYKDSLPLDDEGSRGTDFDKICNLKLNKNYKWECRGTKTPDALISRKVGFIEKSVWEMKIAQGVVSRAFTWARFKDDLDRHSKDDLLFVIDCYKKEA